MSNHHLRNKALSLKAKGLMSLMLSLPDDWDYTTKGLSLICKDGVTAVCSILNELETHKYLTRQRIRNERGQLGEIEYIIHEQPYQCENLEIKGNSPKLGFPVLENPKLENHAQLNTKVSSKEKSITDIQSTHPSIRPAGPEAEPQENEIDMMDAIEVYRQIIYENIAYDVLCERHGAERMDEVMELILEIFCSKRPYIRIAGDEYPVAVVKSRLMKVDSSHVEYVFDCLDKNTTKVRNIKNYLLTALYNAPATIDSYYRAEINHDLYGDGKC